MNHMKQIATNILGLYWDDEKNESEAFKIHGFPESVFRISKELGLLDQYDDVQGVSLNTLLFGGLEIERIPWKPKEGEKYYFIRKNGDIDWSLNYAGTYDAAIIKSGWVFRTEEEARANKERVLKEIQEVLDE